MLLFVRFCGHFGDMRFFGGQHYHFLTMILAFTVVMYGFQLYLEADKHWYAVIAGMALLFWTFYYFAYITCFFLIISVLSTCCTRQNRWERSSTKRLCLFRRLFWQRALPVRPWQWMWQHFLEAFGLDMLHPKLQIFWIKRLCR